MQIGPTQEKLSYSGRIDWTNPEAHIICCMTILYHDAGWDRSIGMVVQELQDPKITQYLFRKNGTGTPGHVRISEAEEMAEELKQYIEGLAIEGWNT